MSLLTASKEVVVSDGRSNKEEAMEEDDGSNATLKCVCSTRVYLATAIIFVIFVLLYSPCFAALIAIGKEIGMNGRFS